MASDYIVKSGDTLGAIAAANNTDVATLAKINNISNPDSIAAGATLKLSAGPTTQDVPGIGTLTITPKAIQTALTGGPEDLSGAYARAGITPPTGAGPAGTANGYVPPKIPGLPTYGSGVDSAGGAAAITKAYQDTLAKITSLESSIAGATVASPEEQALQKQLADAKSTLSSFDLSTLSGEEALKGQGRGATMGAINNSTTVLDRTRALQRLGLAQEADTLTTQLGLAQDARKQQGDLATAQYNLATKKLDLALGLQDKMNSLNEKDQNNARQFLLDTVNFADGKAFTDLDAQTQHAITAAVANSPITLDMVKTALQHGKEKAAATAAGNLRSVAGVGVVQITTDANGKATGYKVVVPENPADSTPPNANTPSFTQYLEDQHIPFPALTQQVRDQLKAEYDAKYAAPVNLGKLTATNRSDLSQAGLSAAPSAVQSYFLNAPSAFRDQYNMDVASGKVKGTPTLDSVSAAYTAWYNANKTGANDWAAILGTQ